MNDNLIRVDRYPVYDFDTYEFAINEINKKFDFESQEEYAVAIHRLNARMMYNQNDMYAKHRTRLLPSHGTLNKSECVYERVLFNTEEIKYNKNVTNSLYFKRRLEKLKKEKKERDERMISTFEDRMDFGTNIINSLVFPNTISSKVLDNELMKIVSVDADECPETTFPDGTTTIKDLSTSRTDNNNKLLKYEEEDTYDTDNESEDNDDDAEVVVKVEGVLDDATVTVNNNWQATNKRKFENKEDIMQKQAKYKEGKAQKVYHKSILDEAKFKKKIATQKTNTAREARMINFDERREGEQGKLFIAQCRNELKLLLLFLKICEKYFGITMRRQWMYPYKNSNSICKNHNNDTADGVKMVDYVGCGRCEQCKMRFVKNVIMLRGCQGTSDDNVLTLFDHIFNYHPVFKNYTLEEWLNIDQATLTVLYWSCSCQYIASAHTLVVLSALKTWFNDNNNIPDMSWFYITINDDVDCRKFRGFGKKTLILIFNGTLGYKLRFGIATDRHVVWRAVKLGWLCDNYGSMKPKNIPPTEVNVMLEKLFPKSQWNTINDCLGALSQYERQAGMTIIDDVLDIIEDNSKYIGVIKKFRRGE